MDHFFIVKNHWRNQRRNLKILESKENGNLTDTELLGWIKAVLKRKFIALQMTM